jgi:hypothetical protein
LITILSAAMAEKPKATMHTVNNTATSFLIFATSISLDSYQFSFAQNAQNILHHLYKPKSCKRLQRLNLVSTF